MGTSGRKRIRQGGDMAEPWMHRFGIEVRAKRADMNMTQQELADRVGYENAGMISQIERGDVTPHFDKVMRLAGYLQLDMNRILGLHGLVEQPGQWFSDMLMLRLPSNIQGLWPPHVQQRAMVQALKGIVEVLEAGLLPGPEGGEEGGSSAGPWHGPEHPVRPIRPSGTE